MENGPSGRIEWDFTFLLKSLERIRRARTNPFSLTIATCISDRSADPAWDLRHDRHGSKSRAESNG